MSIRLVTGPAVEPVSLAEARLHLKEDTVGADIDAKIQMSIQAARELCEHDCRRAFINQQWRMTLDSFAVPSMNLSSATWYGPQWGSAPGPLQVLGVDGSTGYEIYMPMSPLKSIDSVTYIDELGATQTMNVATDLLLNTDTEPESMLPAFNTTWPALQRQAAAVKILFTVGYGPDATTVPNCAKLWILAMLGAFYDLRQAEMAVYRETIVVPEYVDRLLDPLRIRRY